MSNEVAIRVENLSKAYRIGLKEQQHETMLGALAAWVKSPIRNFREVRNLSRFDEVKGNAEDRRSKIEDQGARDGRGKIGDGNTNPNSQLPSAISQSQNSHLPSPTSAPSDIIWALKDVSFEVKHGEAVGVIGRNGAGKSTLLKILSRITEPTRGRAEVFGRVGSLLEVGTGFHPDLTGRENVYLNGTILGMKKREVDARFNEIVEFSGVEAFIDTPVKRYSSGMRVRLAFSVAAHLEAEVLILDEVLAMGDAAFQKRCLGKMGQVAKQGRTVLFVSHNMGAVSNLCTRGIMLEQGRLSFQGGAEQAVHQYNGRVSCASPAAKGEPANVLYQAPNEDTDELDYQIVRIELLTSKLEPMPSVTTWDDVVFRIHYRSRFHVRRGSVAFHLTASDGSRLLLLSTEPDSTLPLELIPGESAVDCCIEKLPLAAGTFSCGAGLALPNAEWLCWDPDLCNLTVGARDVYGSGLAPTSSRALIAVKHQWKRVSQGTH
ncbi:MAG: ABC transporter ATP-binding protein [Limisphaerales bacterium]